MIYEVNSTEKSLPRSSGAIRYLLGKQSTLYSYRMRNVLFTQEVYRNEEKWTAKNMLRNTLDAKRSRRVKHVSEMIRRERGPNRALLEGISD